MKLFGPFTPHLEVMCTDGEQVAKVDYQMDRTLAPTVEGCREAAARCEAQLKEQMGDKWRLCTKREFFDALMHEITGASEQFAMPGSETEWDEEDDEVSAPAG